MVDHPGHAFERRRRLCRMLDQAARNVVDKVAPVGARRGVAGGPEGRGGDDPAIVQLGADALCSAPMSEGRHLDRQRKGAKTRHPFAGVSNDHTAP